MCDAKWLEISFTVDGEMAESIAEVLARFIPDGIVIESTAVTAEADDSGGRVIGPLRVFGYLPVDDKLEARRLQIEKAMWHMSRIRYLPTPQYQTIIQTDWSEAWKRHYRPIAIGSRLLIIPAWLDAPSKDRVPIRINPGMAFGTGTHPSTQLCLELIEDMLCPTNQKSQEVSNVSWAREGVDVIDIGCGSGILSIAALKLGAQRALGVDIDKDAIRSAQENADLNSVENRLELGIGSIAKIKHGTFSIRQASLLLANILAPVIKSLLDEGLKDLLTPNGRLVLAGILDDQIEEVESALDKHGLSLIERRKQEDWVALLTKCNPDR